MKKKLQILNLEDNPNDSDLIKETLEDGGIECEITRVETGEDFLAACDKCGFDIILADFNLPSYDGLSALTIARENALMESEEKYRDLVENMPTGSISPSKRISNMKSILYDTAVVDACLRLFNEKGFMFD